MRKNYLILIYIILFALLNSCCDDCPCGVEEISEFACSPREVTITEFNSSLDGNPQYLPTGTNNPNDATGVVYTPSDEYSIHTFGFPFGQNSSGSLPNDSRFDADRGITSIPFDKIPLSRYGINLPYHFALLLDKPNNANIVGDILVDEVDVSQAGNPQALIRVSGRLARTTMDFLSESSRQFCEDIENNIDNGSIEVPTLRNNLSLYGRNSQGAIVSNVTAGNAGQLVVINQVGQVVASFNGATWEINRFVLLSEFTREYIDLAANLNAIADNAPVALNDMQRTFNDADLDVVQIPVQIGDTFFYRAENGRDFIFSIINIAERSAGDPIKRRVSIIFNEL